MGSFDLIFIADILLWSIRVTFPGCQWILVVQLGAFGPSASWNVMSRRDSGFERHVVDFLKSIETFGRLHNFIR